MGETVGLLVFEPRPRQEIDQAGIVDRLDRLGAPLVGGDELEGPICGEGRPDDLGPSGMLEGLLQGTVLEFELGMMRTMSQCVDDLHAFCLLIRPTSPLAAAGPVTVSS